jgi:hypothetical protein
VIRIICKKILTFISHLVAIEHVSLSLHVIAIESKLQNDS